MYNTLDSHYKKAIEISGAKATINNVETKILVKEVSDEYGIDYKKIITSLPIKQGDYIFIKYSRYMICDKEEKMAQSVYSVGTFRKTLSIQLGSVLKKVEAIIDKNRTVLNDTGEIVDVHDQYKFIVPSLDENGKSNNVGLSQIIYDSGKYNIISIDTSRDGLIIYIGKFSELYNPHVYTIELSEINKTLVEGETYQISPVCKDNGTVITPIPTLTYLSEDETIATISDSGLITGVKAGTCNISVNYNNTITTLSLTVNVKPSVPVISYSATSSNGYSYRVKEGATLTFIKTIDGVTDTTLNVSYTLDSSGQQLLSSLAISVTKPTNNTIQVRNLTLTTVKTFVLTVKDSATGAVIATQSISTRSV